jgi:hypothetical protein
VFFNGELKGEAWKNSRCRRCGVRVNDCQELEDHMIAVHGILAGGLTFDVYMERLWEEI